MGFNSAFKDLIFLQSRKEWHLLDCF